VIATRIDDPMTSDAAPAPIEPETAGVLLRQAREAAGLSLDAVAQQLKLAPRQVDALEQSDYTRLPGRTFVRGFMRNYARLLHLDPEMVLSAMPGAAAAPSLEAPALHATAPSIGELPTAERTRSGMTRWVIPLLLIAIVAGAAVYEYMRPGGDGARNGAPRMSAPSKSIGEAATTALPNPMLAGNAPATIETQPPSAPAAPTPATNASPIADAGAPAIAATGTPSGVSAAEEATLVLAYRDFSWTEVRDRSGHVLLAKMMSSGQQQTLTGIPPFDLVIGNSSDVKLKYRNQPVDLAPLSRGNVARFTLK